MNTRFAHSVPERDRRTELPSGLAKHRSGRGVSLENDGDIMNKSRFSFLPALVLTTVVLSSWTEHVAAQEIALTPLQATEVAKGYRADALRLMPVVNDQTIRSGGSPISFLGMMAAFSLFLPSAILPD